MDPEFVPFLVAIALLAGFAAGALVVRRMIQARPRQDQFLKPQPGPSRADEASQLAESLDIGVVKVDGDLEVVSMNEAARRLLRLSGDPGRSLMATFLDHRVEEAARSALVTGPASIEIALGGTEDRRATVRIRPVVDGGAWLIIEDVTELRRLQRIRTEFVDNISHELRTPLTTIRLLTETLRGDLEHADVPARISERVQKIDVETGHLVQMVNELLSLSRIEGDAATLSLDSIDMATVIAGALERLRTFAERKSITLVHDDSADGSTLVWGDDERLGQVLLNLLHNAIKFSPPDSTVTVATQQREDQLAVQVRDEGPGISRADRTRVFERFYKIDKSRVRGQGGTGLGLAIARHIVEGHRGRIWVEGEENGGSVFTFTIPLATGLVPGS